MQNRAQARDEKNQERCTWHAKFSCFILTHCSRSVDVESGRWNRKVFKYNDFNLNYEKFHFHQRVLASSVIRVERNRIRLKERLKRYAETNEKKKNKIENSIDVNGCSSSLIKSRVFDVEVRIARCALGLGSVLYRPNQD